MDRVLNAYQTSVRDQVELKPLLADATFTEAASEAGIADNQYFYKFNDYFVMQSDGTKRCGFYVDFTNKITNGDKVNISLDLRYISGDLPAVMYEEYEGVNSTQFNKKISNGEGYFETISIDSYVSNRYGTRKGRVFVGLEIGQSGKFSVRFPVITHYAQIKYSPALIVSNTKMFQLSKNSGTWAVDVSNSVRKLDGATLSSAASSSLYLTITKPFIVDVPQLFVMTNDKFVGFKVHFGYRDKSTITLVLENNAGALVNWSTIPDGAIINIMAIAGNYT